MEHEWDRDRIVEVIPIPEDIHFRLFLEELSDLAKGEFGPTVSYPDCPSGSLHVRFWRENPRRDTLYTVYKRIPSEVRVVVFAPTNDCVVHARRMRVLVEYLIRSYSS